MMADRAEGTAPVYYSNHWRGNYTGMTCLFGSGAVRFIPGIVIANSGYWDPWFIQDL